MNPNIHLPHRRSDCDVYKFLPDSKDDAKKYCDKCYCVVCDIPAKDCPMWDTDDVKHCMEKPKLTKRHHTKHQTILL